MKFIQCNECSSRIVVTDTDPVTHVNFHCNPCMISILTKRRKKRYALCEFADPGTEPNTFEIGILEAADWLNRKMEWATLQNFKKRFKKRDVN